MPRQRFRRLQVMLTDQELRVLDGFRFEYRMPSRAAAIRELLKRGLATGGDLAPEGVRSIHFSVIESRATKSRRAARR
jgi:hypothetical protein